MLSYVGFHRRALNAQQVKVTQWTYGDALNVYIPRRLSHTPRNFCSELVCFLVELRCRHYLHVVRSKYVHIYLANYALHSDMISVRYWWEYMAYIWHPNCMPSNGDVNSSSRTSRARHNLDNARTDILSESELEYSDGCRVPFSEVVRSVGPCMIKAE